MKRLKKIGFLAVIFAISVAPATTLAQQEKKKDAVLSLSSFIEVKPRLEAYLKARQMQTKQLSINYGKVIDSQLNTAADAGDLKSVEAFQKEKKYLIALEEELLEGLKDPVKGVSERGELPRLDADAPEALQALRKIWTTEWQKFRIKLDEGLQQTLISVETDLTKGRDFKGAKEVLVYRESLLSSSHVATTTDVDSKSTLTPASEMKGGGASAASATKEKPFQNSLGMQFVPVPITGGSSDGALVLFSVWETRVKDYEVFIRKDRTRFWEDPGFKQKSDHPAVNVSWEDAVAFCKWLTDAERKGGTIGNNQVYRLPTDHEWSCAVGIGAEEDAEATPVAKTNGHAGIYPWGTGFPPEKGAGNYYGEETEKNPIPNSAAILGYNDGFEQTSPVGSFKVNNLGLYDLGGNVWEWCADMFIAPDSRVVRGGAWNFGGEKMCRSAHRGGNTVSFKFGTFGFRIILAGS